MPGALRVLAGLAAERLGTPGDAAPVPALLGRVSPGEGLRPLRDGSTLDVLRVAAERLGTRGDRSPEVLLQM